MVYMELNYDFIITIYNMLKKKPENFKYKKIHKNKIKIQKKNKIKSIIFRFGAFGIKALENGRLTYNQIESTRKVISKKIKKISKIWIRILINIPITTKTSGTRMGRGVGSINYWITKIICGQIIFEINHIKFKLAKDTLNSAKKKLSIKTKFIINNKYFL